MKFKLSDLEDPVLWRKVHNPWISEVYQALKHQVAGRLGLSIDQEAVAYAEGVEQWSAESRHFVVLRDLGGGEVVALLETLKELDVHRGVAWSTIPDPTGRRFRGWAWNEPLVLPKIPWDLGIHGVLTLDLRQTLREALLASGLDLTE